MSKFRDTYIIGVIGIITWVLTIFLRDTPLSNINSNYCLFN
ncbi:hypothetical protein [Clostridium sp. D53t1_180928_C8]|nr:hypothetical protein [Clostridium sp. D53t1_180928_C8]